MQLKWLDGQQGRFTHSLPHLLDFSLRSSTKCIFTVFLFSLSVWPRLLFHWAQSLWALKNRFLATFFLVLVCVFISCTGRDQGPFCQQVSLCISSLLLFIFSLCREGTSYTDSNREYAFQLFLRFLHMNASPLCNCCSTVFFKQDFMCLYICRCVPPHRLMLTWRIWLLSLVMARFVQCNICVFFSCHHVTEHSSVPPRLSCRFVRHNFSL